MKKILVVMLSVVAVMGLVGSAMAADKLLVKDSGANTKFVVTDTGSVGAGTATPTATLTVVDQATTANRGGLFTQYSTDAASAALILRKSRGTEASMSTVASGDYIGALMFRNQVGSGASGTFLRNAVVGARVNGVVSGTSAPTEIYMATSATDDADPFGNGHVRLLISSTGNVGVGTTAPSRLLSVGSGGAGSDGAGWFTSSSREYKDNIQELSADKAIDAIKTMRPVTFNYKEVSPNYTHVGFIAEDVPNLVATPDRKSLSTMDIVAVLTKVVQEQTKTIETLAAKVDMLEKATAK